MNKQTANMDNECDTEASTQCALPGRISSIPRLMYLSVAVLLLSTFISLSSYSLPKLLNTSSKDCHHNDVDNTDKSSDKREKDKLSVLRTTGLNNNNFKTSYTQDFLRALQFREVAMRKYKHSFHVNGVDKRTDLTLEEFQDVYDGKWPVIVTDVVPTWPASQWTAEFFLKHFGEDKVAMVGGNGRHREGLVLPLAQFLLHINESDPTSWTYVLDELFLVQRPQLRAQILNHIYNENNLFDLFPEEIRPWDCMLLWGTAHSRSSLHIDPYNWTGTNAVLIGRKRWKLIPPGQDHLLSIKPDQTCGFPLDCRKYNSLLDAFDSEGTDQHQLDNVRVIEVVQNPGELLIIPTGWYHQAYNEISTFAVSGQMMNENNFLSVLEEIIKGQSLRRGDLPEITDQLSPHDLVKGFLSKVSQDILEQGEKVTGDVLAQMSKNEKRTTA